MAYENEVWVRDILTGTAHREDRGNAEAHPEKFEIFYDHPVTNRFGEPLPPKFNQGLGAAKPAAKQAPAPAPAPKQTTAPASAPATATKEA